MIFCSTMTVCSLVVLRLPAACALARRLWMVSMTGFCCARNASPSFWVQSSFSFIIVSTSGNLAKFLLIDLLREPGWTVVEACSRFLSFVVQDDDGYARGIAHRQRALSAAAGKIGLRRRIISGKVGDSFQIMHFAGALELANAEI